MAGFGHGVLGLAPCCEHCHGRDGLQLVYIDNEPVELCCTVAAEIVSRWPRALRYA